MAPLINANGARSPLAPTLPLDAMTGVMPALSMAMSRSTIATRTPEWLLAKAFTRSAIMARTTSCGIGSPDPAEWDRTRLAWKVAISSGAMRWLLSAPTPVLKAYIRGAASLSQFVSMYSRVAPRAARALSARATLAPDRAMATTSSAHRCAPSRMISGVVMGMAR